jgi:hypothetical protein
VLDLQIAQDKSMEEFSTALKAQTLINQQAEEEARAKAALTTKKTREKALSSKIIELNEDQQPTGSTRTSKRRANTQKVAETTDDEHPRRRDKAVGRMKAPKVEEARREEAPAQQPKEAEQVEEEQPFCPAEMTAAEAEQYNSSMRMAELYQHLDEIRARMAEIDATPFPVVQNPFVARSFGPRTAEPHNYFLSANKNEKAWWLMKEWLLCHSIRALDIVTR